MNALASAVFGIASSVGACVAVAAVASHVIGDSKPHTFKELAAHDLWTAKPVKVDPRLQHYERVPPRYSSYVIEASSTTSKAAGDPPAPQRLESQPKLSDEHLAWCAPRYRSFDPVTNRYRSYDGGIRECSSPFQQIVAEADRHTGTTENLQAAAWCAARYRSYRPEDNTYQPWEGPRRTCSFPNTLPGSDRVAIGK